MDIWGYVIQIFLLIIKFCFVFILYALPGVIIGIILIIYYSIFTIYKQNIAISSITVFLLLTGILNNFDINSLINSNAILSFILIAPELKNTPVSLKGTIIYGIVVGIISALLCQFVSIYTGAFIAIFIVSLSYSILRKFDKKKHLCYCIINT